MLVRGLKTRAHRIDGDVRGPQFLPCLCLANPLVEAAITYGQARFDAERGGIAPRLASVAAQPIECLAHLLVGIALWKPAVAQTRHAPQQDVGASTQPYRDGAARRQWIESRFRDGMVTPFVADDLLAPQQAHDFDLLLYDPSARMEV